MIPKCIVNLESCCYPSKRYDLALKKADQETPKATCQEQVITDVAFGVLLLLPSCYLINMIPPPSGLAICTDTCATASACAFTRALKIQNDNISTGCIRDFTVMKKTFTEPSGVLPFHRMDRT